MKKLITLLLFAFVLFDINTQTSTIKISKEVLQDKIKGGWAGQIIGVTVGGPYEFRYDGTFIDVYQKLMWQDGLIKHNMLYNAG